MGKSKQRSSVAIRMTILFTTTYYTPYVSGLTIHVQRLAEEFAKIVGCVKDTICKLPSRKAI